MAEFKFYAWGFGAVLATWIEASAVLGADPVLLREIGRATGTTTVQIRLEAEGLYRPAPHTGAEAIAEKNKAESSKPLAMKVQTRLEFLERAVKLDPDGTPIQTVRRTVRAGSAVNIEKKPMLVTLRPEVAMIVAEARPEGVVAVSAGGPLTRSELELVQGPADPLALAGLLAATPVALGEKWKVSESAARGLTSYDIITSNGLEAKLTAIDAAMATIHIKGEIKGSVLGGDGSIVCDGSLTFDRKLGRIVQLSVERTESRNPGPVEAGLDVKSSLTLTRKEVETPAELADAVISKYPSDRDPARELLLLNSGDGKYSLLHDRSWHTFSQDARQTVLEKIEKGIGVVQCNLANGPNAGRGRHQDLGQFREDIRKGLGNRYGQILGAGEADGDPLGGFRYKVGVQGRQGDVGIVWSYFLVASPEGDQLVAIFTMAESLRQSFGDDDLTLIGSLRWKNAERSGAR